MSPFSTFCFFLGLAGLCYAASIFRDWPRAQLFTKKPEVQTHDWVITEEQERLKAATMPDLYHRPNHAVRADFQRNRQ